MPRMSHWWLPLVLMVAMLSESRAWAQRVPAKLRVAITFKALTYDRNLTSGRGGQLKIGVVSLVGDDASGRVANEIKAEIKRVLGARVSGLKLSVKQISVKKGDAPAKLVSQAGVNLLYLTPLPTGMLDALRTLGRAKKLLLVSGEAAHSRSHAALTVALAGRKPQIIVNLKLARAQGANFDARLLRLAEVIR